MAAKLAIRTMARNADPRISALWPLLNTSAQAALMIIIAMSAGLIELRRENPPL